MRILRLGEHYFGHTEIWNDREDYWPYNDGWGMCNTGWGQQEGNTFKDRGFSIVCELGGIGCNVDHTFVKVRNLGEKIEALGG